MRKRACGFIPDFISLHTSSTYIITAATLKLTYRFCHGSRSSHIHLEPECPPTGKLCHHVGISPVLLFWRSLLDSDSHQIDARDHLGKSMSCLSSGFYLQVAYKCVHELSTPYLCKPCGNLLAI